MTFPQPGTKAFADLVDTIDLDLRGSNADADIVAMLSGVAKSLLTYSEQRGISLAPDFATTIEAVARELASRRFGGTSVRVRKTAKDDKARDAVTMSFESWHRIYGASRRYYFQLRKNDVEKRQKAALVIRK